ncbi:hypothetical protein ABID22_001549 [Pontibacter aydingkolensis]|uniref:WbqC family protein n=1 Tax=Pontibacter aydingkolensis TaxID=1911536 RepID=A0ABS7CTP6_9BACT|nr:WbqC family protein [Pontibacter aydingkolensis]MBW7467223.1 WbqC family protein [Pontibacter aydingkolensis]
MKKVAILQSNYIPWKGYFDLINTVDEFIIYDDMQYTKRDWRNRNKIKTSNGPLWLTVPVEVKGKFFQKINETKVEGNDWAVKHFQTITQYYSKSKYFADYSGIVQQAYKQASSEELLSNINLIFINLICNLLDIKTKISFSSNFQLREGKSERLLGLVKDTMGSEYISGPAAKNYLNEEIFKTEKVNVTWMDYSGYKVYKQLFPPFDHAVSILDLLFNEGPNATKYMKSFLRENE